MYIGEAEKILQGRLQQNITALRIKVEKYHVNRHVYHRWYIEVFHLPPHAPPVVQPSLATTATPDIGGFPVTPQLCIGVTVSAVTAVKSEV